MVFVAPRVGPEVPDVVFVVVTLVGPAPVVVLVVVVVTVRVMTRPTLFVVDVLYRTVFLGFCCVSVFTDTALLTTFLDRSLF